MAQLGLGGMGGRFGSLSLRLCGQGAGDDFEHVGAQAGVLRHIRQRLARRAAVGFDQWLPALDGARQPAG